MRQQLANWKRSCLGSLRVLCLALISGPIQAADQLLSDELVRLNTWSAHYYEHPEPDRLPGWIGDISASGVLNKASARPPFMMFVSEVARQNPEKVAAWCDVLAELPVEHLNAVAWSFRNAEAPGFERCTTQMSEALRDKLRATKVYSPLDRAPLKPWELDMLWALFLATGDERPVGMIIDVLARPLKEAGTPGSTQALLMYGAARWSLAANARQHQRVAAILANRQQAASGLLREELDKLLVNSR